MLGVSPRDWFEKMVSLWDGNRYLNYSSSICNDGIPSEERLAEGAVRGTSVYSIFIMYRE